MDDDRRKSIKDIIRVLLAKNDPEEERNKRHAERRRSARESVVLNQKIIALFGDTVESSSSRNEGKDNSKDNKEGKYKDKEKEKEKEQKRRNSTASSHKVESERVERGERVERNERNDRKDKDDAERRRSRKYEDDRGDRRSSKKYDLESNRLVLEEIERKSWYLDVQKRDIELRMKEAEVKLKMERERIEKEREEVREERNKLNEEKSRFQRIKDEYVKERMVFEEEKQMVEKEKDKINIYNGKVRLNVGGKIFVTSLSTLVYMQNTYFHAMFSGHFNVKEDNDGEYFIDRDGTHFGYILNYMRDPSQEIILPEDKTLLKQLLREAEFYRIEHLIELITQEIDYIKWVSAKAARKAWYGVGTDTSDPAIPPQ